VLPSFSADQEGPDPRPRFKQQTWGTRFSSQYTFSSIAAVISSSRCHVNDLQFPVSGPPVLKNPNVSKYCGEGYRISVAEMTTVQLVTADDKFFSRTKLGTISGTIYFQIGDDDFFPEKGWTDIPLAVSRAWLEVLVQIADGTVAEETAPFFDGDFSVKVSASGIGSVCLDFLHDEKTKLLTTARIQDLLENALIVGDFLLRKCSDKSWSNGDMEALAKLAKHGARTLARSYGVWGRDRT